MSEVPKEFALQLLSMLDIPVDSIGTVHHWRSPKFSASTKQYIYRVQDFGKLEMVLGEQQIIRVKKEASITNTGRSTEIADNPDQEKSASEILDAAVASKSLYEPRATTTKSTIHVAGREGRITREAEFILYPDLYSKEVNYVKLAN